VERCIEQKRLSVEAKRYWEIDMSTLKYLSVILVGLAATVCQAEIAIEVPPQEGQLEHPSASSGATPSEIEIKVEPLRLAIDLVDGSHIIGVPQITALPLQTSYAKMDIPLTKVLSVTLLDDRETASLELHNGDNIKGILDLKPIAITTAFGDVVIGLEHIDTFTVSTGDLLGRKGLVLHYSFDKQSEQIKDKSGRGHNATVHGAQWTREGKVGGACAFDGRDDYIETPRVLGGLTQFTILTWMRVQSQTHRDYMGICGEQEYVNSPRISGYVLFVGSSQRAFGGSFHWSDKSGADTRTFYKFTPGTWYLLAQTYDGAVVRQYVDGERVNEAAYSKKSLATSGPLRVGKVAAWPGGRLTRVHFHGLLDEIKIFNRALSATEIKRTYTSQK
jgi:hypothetical protein